MGRRGPPKTPIRLLKLRGTYRPDRHAGPELPAAAPNCPTWLSREAKAEWKRLAPMLVERVGLAVIDRAVLAVYCETFAEVHGLVMAIRKLRPRDRAKHEPHLARMRNDARAAMLRYATQLGLSPAARTGLKLQPADDDQATDAENRFFA